MHRRAFLGTVGAAGAVGTAGCGFRAGTDGDGGGTDEGSADGAGSGNGDDESGDDARPDGPDRRFRVGDDGFEVSVDGGPFAEFVPRGVNLGMAKPGRFPGEAAITRAEYDRWLAAMGELNVNVVRVYTVHPPAFYRALAAHNRENPDPIYLLQGNWIGEEHLISAGDAFVLAEEFDRSLRRAVDVVHGATTIDPEPGHASGTYDADVSDSVLGYVAGIEWPPTVVRETNRSNEPGAYDGEYLSSTVDRPFERWLAGRLDRAVAHEVEAYGVGRPAAFTNWVTTDPLSHPYEPFETEDAVTVDPDAVVATDANDAGTFAAYHVYPYYPPLLNETPEYANYVDHRGEANAYAGYLNDLVGATGHPLVVAEFGVPSSRGIAQRHVHGRDQGRHTEEEQGEIVAAMYEDLREVGAAGGLVFSWHDEWFKRTWNLADLSDPNRRPEWSNVQTPEQRFGLLAFDPANAVPLDGSGGAWTDATSATPAGSPAPIGDGDDAGNDAAAGDRELTALRVTSDAAYLSIRLEFADLGGTAGESADGGVDWDRTNYLVTLGLTGRDGVELPYGVDATSASTDFVVRLGGPDDSRVTVHPRYDAFAYLYGAEAGLDLSRYRDPEPGAFAPVRMTINRGYTVPPTGERVPFQSVETGALRYGNGNPDSPEYDSLADVHVSPATDAVEVRLPWLLLNVADPSRRRRLGDLWADGVDAYEPFEAIDVAAASYVPAGGEDDAEAPGSAAPIDSTPTNLAHAVPGIEGDRLDAVGYVPPTWDEPAYDERLKESADRLREVFGREASAPDE
ncbi:hypothetical protein SAMN04488066_10747 [Halorubrum aquaticum]|uniref:Family 2 glycosyl transferase n=1 Tax=Halorubrum aquaticum TaxID=387340 RepID=A0A1I3ART6_9EURY|nr:hypothetical protein [Halorubrum aquaticum]SFH52722.1 hypothetical protein SAMN04488066_10747 [Halorubrum aquaticum]